MVKLSKEELKDLRKKKKLQHKIFRKRLNSLFKTEYRYSLKFEEAHVFDDGKAYINVDLTKCESPFSIYSYDNRINPEIYDYINQETFFLPVDIPVVINFDDDGKYDEAMKEKIKRVVIRHYSLEYEDKRYELHKFRRFGVFCGIIGIAVMAAYLGLSVAFSGQSYQVLFEVLQIISWVFIWESVDRFALTGLDQVVGVLNAGQLALVEVQFGKSKEKELKK